MDTDSDDEGSVASEATSMVSTQSKASTSSQAVGKKPVIIKPRNVIRADLLDNINNAQGFLPSLADTLHTTGIPASLYMTCYDHQTSKGARRFANLWKPYSLDPLRGVPHVPLLPQQKVLQLRRQIHELLYLLVDYLSHIPVHIW